mmetsp:Transcript_14882/g.22892  ORF Transcript_14882/g.22892 Transcript_14882/m.22892 type:complete len:492 (+) Transcript_14882:243-1718(+)|eukprot:CAMPEP_0194212682 /NCGR_PEP_ID=MMETSP0156-20130528/12697_1 /TAXON_ID=33649 /ORGANISM="Thalassionema nitzschioides, Strain L26-B" /LENGTH=491 /DNA_ID=CAMNT_0038940553 /DNA_START=164 /DNA_END=1639 /DNA_ORIENTATION=+
MSSQKKTFSLVSPPKTFDQIPNEINVSILTYLRAYDLSALHQTCRFFASKSLVQNVIKHTLEHVYSKRLTDGFELEGKEYSFETLRDVEWLVIARVLSRPEPVDGFYVSKSWCKTALKWLEVQDDERKKGMNSNNGNSKRKEKKLSKKKQRMRTRRLSDATPPWPNATSDLLCCHENLQHCNSTRAAKAKRRLLDKQAWKMLKKLYPDSVSLKSDMGECLQCRVEEASRKEEQRNLVERQREERRKLLSCPIIRGIYTRTRGVPIQSYQEDGALEPGLYYVLPRAWLYNWRRYIKTGEEGNPGAPDASCLLCDGHRLPLIPPHLESYLYGETSQLLVSAESSPTASTTHGDAAALPVGMSAVDSQLLTSMRAAGISQRELEAQRTLYPSPYTPRASDRTTSKTNKELLDIENKIVVEILTEQEYNSLEKLWPHSNFSLRFRVDGPHEIKWSTIPCRECDASGKSYSLSVRKSLNRSRKCVTRTSSASMVEY